MKSRKDREDDRKWLWNLYLSLLPSSPAHPARVLAWKLQKTTVQMTQFPLCFYCPETKRWPLKVSIATCPRPTGTSPKGKYVLFFIKKFLSNILKCCLQGEKRQYLNHMHSISVIHTILGSSRWYFCALCRVWEATSQMPWHSDCRW